MADISSYLAAIMAAVYGEDVRGSIHDAIDIINKVGEVVLNTGTAVTGPTSSSTGFYDGSFYINTNTMELWKCIGTDAWQSQGILKGADGADGNGIVSIVKTATVGLVDTYTITFDDGSTETYQITNGQNGSKWYKGTAISGTGTSITGFPGTKDDFYLNSVDGYVYVCTKTGGAMVPDAAEWDYVMTLTGGGGGSITVIDNLISTSSTDALSANQGRVLNTSKIDNPSTKSDGQVLTYNGTIQEWEAQNPSGGGMLPYLYIDSEAGATVTVNQPDGTVITPTAAGSGHWECELTGGYGTYVIHSVLSGQGDATQSLSVDTVKEYHVTDTHYDHTVSFVAPSGSTVRIEGGTEIYTLTGTGSTQTQAVHSASTSFTVTATMDGNGKPYTFTTPSTTGQTTTIPSGTFDFGTINVSVAADFVTAGSTITCVNGGTSCTPKTAASTLVFRVPTTGTWTISGEVSGTPYSTTATVTDLNTPESASLATTLTLSVDLYSAAQDTVSFTDDEGVKTVITDTDGHATATIKILPTGKTITFTSSVALDPDNLDGSHYYSKTVSVTTATTDVYVMPDNSLYWYGYTNNVESMLTSNGWSGGTFSLAFNTNMATLARTTRKFGGIGTTNAVSGVTKLHFIFRSSDSNINGAVVMDAAKNYSSTTFYRAYGIGEVTPVNAWRHDEFTPTGISNGYIAMWSDSACTVDWAAFWYE